MEESRAKLKKTATESLRGRLLAEDVDVDAILKATREELVEFVLQIEGHDVGVTIDPQEESRSDATDVADDVET